MSQLFDSLRRGRRSALPKAPRTAHGDAVLATLGYAPVRRGGGGTRSSIGRVLIAAGVIAACVAGWKIYFAPAPVRPVPSTAPQPVPTGSSASGRSGVPDPRSGSTGAAAPPRSSSTAPPPTSSSAPPSISAPPSPSARVVPPKSSAAPPSAATASARETGRSRPPAPVPVSREPVGPAVNSSPTVKPSNDRELALYYHRAGDFENALQHYRALLQQNELDAQAHNNLGLLYQEKNLLEESARELQRAILIEPHNVRAHNNYGATLLRQGRTDEATAEFQAVLKLEPRNVDALVNLALAQRAAHQPDVAKETLLRALTIAPRSADAHYTLALLYDETNEAARAIDHYRKFLENAGTERASSAAAVRARIAVLSKTPADHVRN